MAPKKPSRFVDNPPSASPSQDHEEESEEEVVEEEQEQEKTPKKSQKNPEKPKPSSSSSEEEEEGSDDDDDDDTKSSPTASDFTIKPIVPTNTNTTKIQQQQGHSKEPTKPTSKRALEVQKDDDKKDSTKKKSKVSQENGEETKRVAAAAASSGGGNVGRLWSDDDEIGILKGMIDYQNQKGADPHADMGAFHEFVKGRFRFDVTKTQLYEKVRRLKKKFFNNVEKGGDNGQDPSFSKPHEFDAFQLSKKIWGANNAITNGVDENLKSSNDGKAKKSGKVKSFEGKTKEDDKKKREDEKKKEEDDEKMIVEKEVVEDEVVKDDEGDFSEKYPNLNESFDVEILPMSESQRKFVKGNISLIDSQKARELDENWKRLQIEEVEFFYRKSKLMVEQTRLVLDATKKR